MFYIFLRNYGTVEWNVDPGLESRFKHMQSGRNHLTSSTILDFDSQHSCIARRGIEGRGGEGRGGEVGKRQHVLLANKVRSNIPAIWPILLFS